MRAPRLTAPPGRRAALRRRISDRLGQDSGSSLIEMLVALTIFAVVALGTMSGLTASINATRNSRVRIQAANIAGDEMDRIRSAAFAQLAATTGRLAPVTRTVGNTPYAVVRESEWIPQTGSTNGCDSPSGASLAYLRFTVEVTWPNMRNVAPVTAETIVTPPAGSFDPYTGHIGVTIRDRLGAPAAGHRVAVTGPSPTATTRFVITTSEGCAFFAYLNAGQYDVSIDDGGYVDLRSGAQLAVQTQTVLPAQTSPVTFDYDREATIEATLAGAFGGTVPPNVALTLANSNLQPSGLSSNTDPGVTKVVRPLFPFPSGYGLWAGSCTEANPGHPSYGGTSADTFAALPGGTTTATVTMGTVNVLVVDSDPEGPFARPGVSVSARSLDAGCTEAYDFGATGANGGVSAGLPFGNWEISIGGELVPVLLQPGATTPTDITVVQP